jgi:uroporphyrinogen-III synthase
VSAPPIWVVRPEPGNGATLRRLAALGLAGRAMPLFEGEAVPWAAAPASQFDALMLTSANAVRHAGPGIGDYAGLPLWAVGSSTAAAAQDAGLAVARSGAAGVAALLDGAQGRILWLCGEERTEPPMHPDLTVTPVAVYRMVERPVTPGALDPGSIILLHSARAARCVAALIGSNRPAFTIIAMSADVAAAAGEGWKAIIVASAPTDAEMVAVAARLCQ